MNSKSDSSGNSVVDFPEPKSVRAQACRWLARLDTDVPSPRDIAAFRQWVRQDEAHRIEFEELVAFWGDMNILTQIMPPREEQTHNGGSRLWCSLNNRGLITGIVLCSLLAVAVLLINPLQSRSPAVYTTAVGEQRTIHLPDGSSVLLNTNSRIEVHFTDERRIIHLLRGEAHFEVFRDRAKPFEVHAGRGLVRALGTAFTVYLRDRDVEVVVTEGVVEIDAAAPPEAPAARQTGAQPPPEQPPPRAAVKVTAGNLASYDWNPANEVRLAEVEKMEDKLSWHQGMLVFKGEPLEQVVAEVSRYTSMKIVIPQREAREMKVGGLFKVGDTESMFEALRDGFGIHAERVSDDFVYLVFSESQ